MASLLPLILMSSNAGAECPGNARLSGTLETERGKIRFRTEPVHFTAGHCIDVDREDQGGCVSYYRVSTAKKRGCLLTMVLYRDPIEDVFKVRSLSFSTDSYCPGWFDDAEQMYMVTSPSLDVKATRNVRRGQEILDVACFNARVSLGGTASFRSSQRRLNGELKGFVVSGIARSEGKVNRRCVRKPEKQKVAKPRPARSPQKGKTVAQGRKNPAPSPKPVVEVKRSTIRIDLGAGLSDGDTAPWLQLSYGKMVTPVAQILPTPGLGVGIAISNSTFELHPRILVVSKADQTGGVSLGATARGFFTEHIGLHAAFNIGWQEALAAGFSLRF